jgi:hypothetical protein
MARLQPLHCFITAGLVCLAPGMTYSQSNQILVPVKPTTQQIQPVADWVKVALDTLNNCWMESNVSQRGTLLHSVAEQTPAHLAYLTRVFQQNNPVETIKLVRGIKDYFSLLRRINWTTEDMPHVQRIVASWTVTAPQLIKLLSTTELNAQQRRVLEQALIDLALLGKDAQLGSSLARQSWQTEAATLGKLALDTRLSVRLAALGVLEAIGPEAQQASSSVVTCLNDKSSFVRWSAVRTIQSIGPDTTAITVLNKLKKDDDAQVREAVMLALASSTTSVNTVAMSGQKPVVTAPVTPPVAIKTTVKPDTPVTHDLPKLDLTPLPALKTTIEPSKAVPVVPASLPEKKTPPVTVPVNNKPAAPAVLPSAMQGKPLHAPETKGTPVSQPAPMFAPTSQQSTRTTPSPIQPVNASQPARVSPVAAWLPKLRVGTAIDEQLHAVRELAKLGPQAGEAVPALAELLIKGDVTVRREVPGTLALIGKPAKVATVVLEHCLQDEDTDVKVNAARALLELADH